MTSTETASAIESEPQKHCRLCGLQLHVRGLATGEFCCQGCMRVFDVLSHLSEKDAEAYVVAARKLGVIPAVDDGAKGVVGTTNETTPAVPIDPEAVRTSRFVVDGMSCPSCAWIVEQVLTCQSGVHSAEVNFFTDSVLLHYDMRLNTPDKLADTLQGLGYDIHESTSTQEQFGRRLTFDFVLCAILTMNIMSLAGVRYFAELGEIASVPMWLPYVEFALLLPVLYLGWLPVLRRAFAGLRRRTMTMDTLIAVAVGSVLVISIAALMLQRSDIYFETCAGLISIALLSRMVEARLRVKALADIATLMKMQVTRVRAIDAQRNESFLSINDVQPGQVLRVLEGEAIAFDGIVVGETCWLNEALLNGEPRPVCRDRGGVVHAGSTVVQGVLELQVQRRYDDTQLKRIVDGVSASLREREAKLRSADRLAAWFTPAVLLVAVMAWLLRWFLLGPEYAFSAAAWFPSAAVMVVACPCAFSLAGMTAATAAIGALLRQGVLVKDPAQLEELSRLKRIVFDKTGTLTQGHMSVEQLLWRDVEDNNLLGLVAAVEKNAVHPVARAVYEYLLDHGANDLALDTDSVENVVGMGRRYRVDGRVLCIGSEKLFDKVFEVAELGPNHSVAWCGWDGVATACFLLKDHLRPEVTSVVAALKVLGLEVEILSGDRVQVCAELAAVLGGLDYRGDLSIDAKMRHMQTLSRKGQSCAFVGDGTNDALAMGQAQVAIAVGPASDEALSAGGFVLLHNNLMALPKLIACGHRLHRVVRANYLWALSFNVVFIPVAVAGWLTPLLAMLLMLSSSVVVLTNSLRLRRESTPR